MILNALVDYYDRLEADPRCEVAPFGFSRQKISFEIVLGADGSLFEFHDARQAEADRIVARPLVVPGQTKPSGSGISPCFLWDNAQYMVGFKPDDPKPERTVKAFEAFRQRHLDAESNVDDGAFSAVCRFLESWDPADATDHPVLSEIGGSFGVFRMQGAREYVHDRAKVRAYWCSQLASGAEGETPTAPSLINGELQPIARLHEPKIKGVRGGQTRGCTLVGFNADAYESYGKKQGFNAPVGVEDAFKYCTALNHLTTARNRQVHLGDTTVVYWSERPTSFEDGVFGVFEPTHDAEDTETVDRLRGFFNRLRRAAGGGTFDDGDVPFYVMGLAPNAARVSVRFWLAGTVQQFAERLGRHIANLALNGAPPNMPPISIQRIIDQTARERADIQPLLGGAILRSVLSGSPYPVTLAAAILRRIRADGQTSGINGYIRAATIKAYLLRRERCSNQQETIAMELDENNPHAAYHLGRMFAALEKTQEDALGRDLNVTIKDRYFSAASANPVAAFPRLLRLHAHHLDKLGADNRGLKITREKLMQEICAHIDAENGFPVHLPLDEQGRFFIGYYHQRQAFFTSRKPDTNAPADVAGEE